MIKKFRVQGVFCPTFLLWPKTLQPKARLLLAWRNWKFSSIPRHSIRTLMSRAPDESDDLRLIPSKFAYHTVISNIFCSTFLIYRTPIITPSSSTNSSSFPPTPTPEPESSPSFLLLLSPASFVLSSIQRCDFNCVDVPSGSLT